jgi:L-rhamnose-H+ transport protein
MSTSIGILFAVISGIFDGSFGTIMKVTKKWEWENIWLLFSITAMAVFPVILALACVSDLPGVYAQVPMPVLWRTFLFGMGWGIGNVLFGLGLFMLGQSLAYTVMVGLIAVGGSLIPMLVTSPDKAPTVGGAIIVLSMIVTIVGVAYCGRGGKLRDDSFQNDSSRIRRHSSFTLAFLVCVGAGLFSCMFNLAFHFGKPIADAAGAQLGGMSDSFRANTPIWLLVMLGGFLPNLFYCVYLLVRKGSWRKYMQPDIAHYWLCGILMGAAFAADITFYGIGADHLGPLGTTVGWIVMNACGIMAANSCGVMTGEWNGAPAKARWQMAWGSLILFASIVLVSIGNYLLP